MLRCCHLLLLLLLLCATAVAAVLVGTHDMIHERQRQRFPRQTLYTTLPPFRAKQTGVTDLHCLHVWSLTLGRTVVSAHIKATDPEKALAAAHEICEAMGVAHSTIQVRLLDLGVETGDWHRILRVGELRRTRREACCFLHLVSPPLLSRTDIHMRARESQAVTAEHALFHGGHTLADVLHFLGARDGCDGKGFWLWRYETEWCSAMRYAHDAASSSFVMCVGGKRP